MAVPFSNSKLRVPAGFQSLLEGVAKEVLMMQPPDIYAFCAMYFESRLTMRDGGTQDPSTHTAQIEDRTYNNSAFQKPDIDASSPSQTEAATTIQTKYRQFQAKTTADELRQEKAAVKIQSCARGFVARQKVKEMREERQSGVHAQGLDDELEPLPDGEEPFHATPLASSRTGGEPADEDHNLLESNRSNRSTHSRVSASPKASPVASPSPAPEQHLEAAEDGRETERKSRNFEEEGVEDDVLESHRTLGDEEEETARTHRVPRDAETGNLLDSSDMERGTSHHAKTPQSQRGTRRSHGGTPHNLENKDGKEEEDMGTGGLFGEDTPRANEYGDDEEGGGVCGGCAPESPHEAEDGKASVRSVNSAVESARLGEGEAIENDEELEKAATKIQAGFRGMKVRQELKEEKENTGGAEDDGVENNDTELDVGENAEGKRVETEDGTETERLTERETDEKMGEEFGELDPEVEMAAIKIQAGFRGMKAREEIRKQKGGQGLETADDDAEVSAEATKDGEDGEINEVDDPDLERAASKIQAGFRGMKTRKELREAQMDEEGLEKSPGNVELEPDAASVVPSRASNRDESPLDEDNKDLEKAATKIQAGFRGYKTRKELKLSDNTESEKPVADESEAVDVEHHPMSPKEEPEEKLEEKPEGLDDDDPALQDAAIKIQAGFRGFKARKELKDNAEAAEPANAESERVITPAAETVPLEDEKPEDEKQDVEKSADDMEDPAMNNAATKIQAGFKGYKTRKEFKEKQREDAVEKIQAGFKAYQVRKNLKTPENDADENADENEAS